MSDRGRSPSPAGSGGPSGSGRRPSQSPARSATGSAAGGPAAGWSKGPGFDPAKPQGQEDKGNTRMELPPDAYVSETKKDLFTLRNGKFNTEGKPEHIEVNQYRMTKFDFSKKIYQYDVFISPNPDKIGPVMKKIWAHPTTQKTLKPYKFDMWLFDGKKLAWGPVLVDRGELRFNVDLDEGQRPAGAKPRDGGKFYVTIRKTTEIQVAALQGYLEHKISFNNSVQEALNFLDHLVRQYPSKNLLAIKRNFYRTGQPGAPLQDGAVVEVHKGTYASVRMSDNLKQRGVGLGYNIDVANTCFWIGNQPMDRMICNFLATLDGKFRGQTPATINELLKPIKDQKSGRWGSSEAFKQLRKMRRLKFKIKHKGRKNEDKLYSIQDFTFDEKFGEAGASARTVTFDKDGKQISVYEYYKTAYNVTLRLSHLPLIDAGKGGKIPMELAFIEPMQRYPFKLNPDQTAAMIKIAVTRPNVRKGDIQKGAAALQIGNDPFLKEYGVNFEPQFAKTEARILAPPIVRFGQGTAEPKFAGRWDLRGKKFWKQNTAPLMNWGFIALEQPIALPALQAFAASFKTTFLGHGGRVTGEPQLLNPPGNLRFDAAKAIEWAHEEITRRKGYTQLLFVVVSKKNSGTYERLKKSADIRFGILTQVVLGSHVQKNNGQYHSNVCMKVNAKLGGATACTPPLWKTPTFFPDNRPTMMVGVDVSHAAPGGVTPSTASMTMSVDKDATRYAAVAETNGYRVEMLTPSNIRFMFGELIPQWKANHPGKVPTHIIYFRDGVGEGQFAYVLDQEIAEIKAYLRTVLPGSAPFPKFTVIVATKRHHIRFFPQRGDKNGNPLPGTLVEREVTHPFMFDFYLNSHVAIQGTARPVHYHVLMDEMGMPVNDLQKMIYQQCYSYARSTTPVSLHPAVYYAHLASNRARAHENIATSEGFRIGPKGHEMTREKVARGISTGGPDRTAEAPVLLRLGGPTNTPPVAGEQRQRDFFRSTMWYI
ncbi:Protein argonaute [Fusarium torreyae]|uniref:Protein argonaute n=1 Tax=Fusarium torreyae TaxID=1237075 RepID=A0A9W8VND8_9HYPO|nr:Protein argonaute [Fusarium torreyae]